MRNCVPNFPLFSILINLLRVKFCLFDYLILKLDMPGNDAECNTLHIARQLPSGLHLFEELTGKLVFQGNFFCGETNLI